jgi:hypothetical protein
MNNLYLADHDNNRVRKVNAATGIITTIAGTGAPGDSGYGGPATAAEIYFPARIIMDDTGNIYVSVLQTRHILRIDAITGIIILYAGAGGIGGTGDNGPAASAGLAAIGMCFDTCGNMFVCDGSACRIRVITPTLPRHLCDFASAVPEIEKGNEAISMYPNPAMDKITITGDKIYDVAIYDLLGRTIYVMRCDTPRLEVDVSGLLPGIYLVKINDERMMKFVKE